MAKKKWIICSSSGASDIIPDALHIERNDAARLPETFTDFDAANEAKKSGVNLINDIPGIYSGFYLDTDENRKLILDYIRNHPEEVGTTLVGKI